MSEGVPFWENWPIWWEAMLVALLAGAGLAYLGVWVVLKRVVYVPLALSQVAAVGVVVAFLIEEAAGLTGDSGWHCLCEPSWIALLFAVASAFYFARTEAGGERATGVAYLVCSALVLTLGAFVRRDLHDISGVLFGQAVLAQLSQVVTTAAALLLVLGSHLLCHRRLLFAAHDPAAAGAAGLRVYRLEVLLYAGFALMLSVATRALGALPAFGLCVLPALAALRVARGMGQALALSTAFGLVSAGLGYYLSFAFELPAGASMVLVAGLLLAGASAFKK
ncbi:MAG TPA: metal ABC transporter permease [Myxococcota bacterium]|nr:metal ABC transporter permease [Myxococcota bacterium]HRY97401.1 metal ABC transporter permease [Myxococcota bacterium]HSA23287.1 metal ABC transporter permease [Myxococcota bacterium]